MSLDSIERISGGFGGGSFDGDTDPTPDVEELDFDLDEYRQSLEESGLEPEGSGTIAVDPDAGAESSVDPDNPEDRDPAEEFEDMGWREIKEQEDTTAVGAFHLYHGIADSPDETLDGMDREVGEMRGSLLDYDPDAQPETREQQDWVSMPSAEEIRQAQENIENREPTTRTYERTDDREKPAGAKRAVPALGGMGSGDGLPVNPRQAVLIVLVLAGAYKVIA